MDQIINKDTPKKIIWLLLYELWQQKHSMMTTQSNAWSISSEDSLNKAIKKNKEETDYLLNLLK